MTDEITILNGKINIAPLIKAQRAFDEAVAKAQTQLERDGAIQRFEFTYELLWKMLKKVLAFKGLNINNPRDVFREAAKEHLIEDPKIWFEVIKKRNMTTHIYSEMYAKEIFEFLPHFQKQLSKIIDQIKNL
ncbi:MAG: Nucleotidyltransferase substrate binding protein, HI0074 family [candidate division TM6 bacterium GW2011_GWE2_36_25]|nr:MAG: Nucleotidyltransferase substrate binding protein, HI0074 family [candidate division TM6 bacterium GW2011_GWF2_36_131]KKQ02855.1 MAG: Nucleotidyltransferase substrate binding protein, HI0074 family [candidate division TM6 bacterium GW2011_GWE2_36_25]KKQ19508.1 MAG: Nucleotidyltransferase substrate binding protein, HI0074 family [candidate division TM6 bacterium GW2011_GWA2_36_9]